MFRNLLKSIGVDFSNEQIPVTKMSIYITG